VEVRDENTGLLLEHLFRHQSGRLIAHLAGVLGPQHLDLAEETVQEAMVRALRSWPFQGIPENPAAWLYRTAQNIAIDHLRRGRLFGTSTEELAEGLLQTPPLPYAGDQVPDDELRLMLMCCHPEISREAAVALSLKIAGGFSVREIARAFLVEESAIAQRIVRAKRQIREKQLTLEMPSGLEAARRIESVLEVLYLLFNEGYTAHDGDALIRQDLCGEALRLASLVAGSRLATPASHALTALLALQAARFRARVNAEGDLVPLEEQERTLWDAGLIARGFRHFELSMMGGERVTAYHVQAAIAATHARARDGGETPWDVILALYDQLMAVAPSAVVALNRAVAVWKVRGALEGLRAVESLGADLREYHLYHAVLGHLLLALGRREEAARSFSAAIECPCSEPERRLLRRLLLACG
jgi:RNA polymerase sigma-70 factor (ECF subfamily)